MLLAAEDERRESVAAGADESNPFARQRSKPINLFRVGKGDDDDAPPPAPKAEKEKSGGGGGGGAAAAVRPPIASVTDADLFGEGEGDDDATAGGAETLAPSDPTDELAATTASAPSQPRADAPAVKGGLSLAAFRARLKAAPPPEEEGAAAAAEEQ
jgi:hypothetical protein